MDVDLGDVDAHRKLEWLRTLFTLGRRQAQKLHLTRAQQLDLQPLVRKLRRGPLEHNVVRSQPERRCIADLGTGNAQIVGKVSRDAGKDDLPAAQLRGRALKHAPSPIHVGEDEDQRDQDDRHDDQDTGCPSHDFGGLGHQNAWPNPM